MKVYPMFKRDIFYDTKSFGGKTFKMSLHMPAALIYCTKEKAEGVANTRRENGILARIIKRRYVDKDGHSRVAYMVYER